MVVNGTNKFGGDMPLYKDHSFDRAYCNFCTLLIGETPSRGRACSLHAGRSRAKSLGQKTTRLSRRRDKS